MAFFARLAVAALTLLCVLAGCQSDGRGAGWEWGWPWPVGESAHAEPAPGQSAVPGPVTPQAAPAADRLEVAQLEFDVYRLDLPVGPDRHALKIWNHVDELRADAEHLVLLARNGLRVGVAPQGALPALRTLIESVDARMTQGRQAVQMGAPLIIKLASLDAPQEFFRFDASGSAIGGTLREADKSILIRYEWRQPRRLRTTLAVTLALTATAAPAAWDPLSGAPPEPAYTVFEDLTSALSIEDGEYVVIGTGKDVDKDYLLGNCFLTYPAAGGRWETVLLICPRTTRVPTPRS
ncbi:MAG: hypothetical protein C4547_16515 [Phycisphaerales bacterium]|nr:MAG: hypothetical protein C4547_16515 [Phycisphaerales bacterium]